MHYPPLWLALLVLAAAGSAAAGEPAFAPATYQDLAREKYVEGVVEAVNQATVTAQTSGEVLEVNFDVDDYVEQGAVLARLRNTEHLAASAQAAAQLAEAEAYYKAAQNEYERVKKVFEKQAASASALDKVRADLDSAKARLGAARAATRRAVAQEEYTVISAPYSGVVIERHIQPGEIARAGSPVMTGLSLERLRVVAHVSQTQINAVREHNEALVLVESENGMKLLDSTHLTISPQAHPPTHTFKVRIDLVPNIPGLFPGMHVKVGFVVGRERALTIPAQAVAYRGEVRGVYVQGADGGLRMRMVRLGAKHGDVMEILAGLSEGEQVALDPVEAAVVRKSEQAGGNGAN